MPVLAQFTDQEKERVHYHLGYGSLDSAAALSFGLPITLQPLFIVDQALNITTVDAANRVRRLLNVLDGVDQKLIDAQDRLAAKRLDTLETRPDEPDALEREYYRWACRLADTLRVPLYPYSQRFAQFIHGGGPGGAGSIPVRD